jgi:hypothetical protein
MSVGTMLKSSRLMSRSATSVCISPMPFPAVGGLGNLIFLISLVFQGLFWSILHVM